MTFTSCYLLCKPFSPLEEPQSEEASGGIGDKIGPIAAALAEQRCLHDFEQAAVANAGYDDQRNARCDDLSGFNKAKEPTRRQHKKHAGMYELIEAQQIEPMRCGHVPVRRVAKHEDHGCPGEGEGEGVFLNKIFHVWVILLGIVLSLRVTSRLFLFGTAYREAFSIHFSQVQAKNTRTDWKNGPCHFELFHYKKTFCIIEIQKAITLNWIV
jgi:hypothetical protein